MKNVIHAIKLFFAKVKWFFFIANIALFHKQNINNFQFLFDKQKEVYDHLLKLDRESDIETDDKKYYRAKVELIDDIISYITGNDINR